MTDDLIRIRSHVEPSLAEILTERAMTFIQANRYLIAPLIAACIYLINFFILLIIWFARPYYIHKLSQAVQHVRFPWLLEKFFPFLFEFHYSEQVVDAWLKHHAHIIRKRFLARDQVKERESYLPLAISFEGEPHDLSLTFMRTLLEHHKPVVVAGEGGIGKTTIAIRFARTAMACEEIQLFEHLCLPVFLDTWLPDDGMVDAVSRQAQLLTGEGDLPSGFIRIMIRARRTLVIVDALSEQTADSQAQALKAFADFPKCPFIITTRSDQSIRDISPLRLHPPVLEKDILSNFVAYKLKSLGKYENLNDKDFTDALGAIHSMIGERKATPLLAGLYVDQYTAAFEGRTHHDLPTNVPDLILGYVRKLNKPVDGVKVEELDLVHALSSVARLCVEPEFIPMVIREEDVVPKLKEAGVTLEYLLKNMLIEKHSPDKISVRFDTVSEYLAAIAIAKDSNTQWPALAASVTSKHEDNAAVINFVRALRDAIKVYGNEYHLQIFANLPA